MDSVLFSGSVPCRPNVALLATEPYLPKVCYRPNVGCFKRVVGDPAFDCIPPKDAVFSNRLLLPPRNNGVSIPANVPVCDFSVEVKSLIGFCFFLSGDSKAYRA